MRLLRPNSILTGRLGLFEILTTCLYFIIASNLYPFFDNTNGVIWVTMGMFQAVGGIHIQITVIITNTLILGLRESFGSFLQALEEVLLALKL